MKLLNELNSFFVIKSGFLVINFWYRSLPTKYYENLKYIGIKIQSLIKAKEN